MTREILRQGRRSRVLVVEFDDRMPPVVRRSVWSAITVDDVLSESDLEGIDDAAAEFASRWYRVGRFNGPRLAGVWAGEALRVDVYLAIGPVLKNLACALRLLERYDVSHMLVGAGVGLEPWAWQAAASKSGVEVTDVPLDAGPAEGTPQRRPSRQGSGIRDRARRWRQERQRSRSDNDDDERCDRQGRLVVALHAGRGLCDCWFERLRSDRRMLCVPFRPDGLRTLGTLAAGWWVKAWCRLVFALASSRMRRNPVYRHRGIDLWPYWRPSAQEYFFRAFPSVLRSAARTRAWLRRRRVSGLVITWHELHRWPYLAAVAGATGACVVTLQDSWLPGPRFPNDHRRFLRCHVLATWGQIGAEWARCLQGARIATVGHPQISDASDLLPQHRLGSSSGARRLRIVLTHQCWGRWSAFHSPLDTNDTLDLVADAAARHPEVDFVVKVHPLIDQNESHPAGISRSREIFDRMLERGLSNLSVAALESTLEDVLGGADLVMTYYSLTALDAIAGGVPVAMVNMTSKRDLFPELVEVLGVTAIRSAGDLDTVIEKMSRSCGPSLPSRAALDEFHDRALQGSDDVVKLVWEALNDDG
jgi:hypothetical protein